LSSAPVGLIAGWSATSLLALIALDAGQTRFLDLPLGAYLAIQGAVLCIVLVGMSAARPH